MRNALLVFMIGALLVSISLIGLAHEKEFAKPMPGFGFGGPMIGLFVLDLGAGDDQETVNGILAANGYATLPNRMITFGGGGGGGVIGGISLGGSGWGGSIDSLREGKKAEFSLGFGGMDIAYTVGGNEQALLLIGAVLGGGGLDLKLRDRIPTSFEDAVAAPTSTTLSRGFFGAEPYVRFQIQPFDWLGFEFHLGYLLTLVGNWEEGGQELAGPTLLEVSGPFVGLSIALGGIERQNGTEAIEGIPEEVP